MTFANSRFRKANGHSKFTLAGSYKFNSVGTAFSLTMRINRYLHGSQGHSVPIKMFQFQHVFSLGSIVYLTLI
jgi:hypothetical protein